MLHKLTMDDLSVIHLQSCLHLASLRRGIQVMRECKWDSSCLIRRSSGESITNEPVELWTSHRVMEWLRAIDLAEYVPNLRGAGKFHNFYSIIYTFINDMFKIIEKEFTGVS